MLVPDSIDAIRTAVMRPASVGRVVIGRPSDDPYRSCLGRVSVIGHGEDWPTLDGRPMASLAQLNLTEAAFVPEELAGFALVSVWIADDNGSFDPPDGRPNGDGWVVRAYRSLDELVVVDGRVMDGIRPRQLDWVIVEDYPDWEDLVGATDFAALERLLEGRDAREVIGSATSGTKLGGWPSLIQGEIDSEERVGLNLWDSGLIHVGAGTFDGARVWVAEVQAY
jgi:hypothetical protein